MPSGCGAGRCRRLCGGAPGRDVLAKLRARNKKTEVIVFHKGRIRGKPVISCVKSLDSLSAYGV